MSRVLELEQRIEKQTALLDAEHQRFRDRLEQLEQFVARAIIAVEVEAPREPPAEPPAETVVVADVAVAT